MSPDPDRKPPPITNLPLRVFFTVVCVMLFFSRIVQPDWFKDLKPLDYIPLALAAVPWLAAFVTGIKLPGGFEATLADLYEKVEKAEASAAKANYQGSMLAVSPGVPPPEPPQSPLPPTSGRPPPSRPPADMGDPVQPMRDLAGAPVPDTPAALAALAVTYAQTRRAMQGGPARTAKMTIIVRDMVAVAEGDRSGTFPADFAASPDPSLRLAACAWAVANPGRADTALLVDIADTTTQPFVQYWALVALQKVAEAKGKSRFSPALVTRLRGLRGFFADDPDRAFALSALLQTLRSDT